MKPLPPIRLLTPLLALATAGLLFPQNLRTLRDVRYSSFGDYTRVIIELSETTNFSEQRIDNPERVFFDLTETVPQLASGKRGAQIVPVGDRFLKQIRMGENQPGLTRLVFDLTETHVEYRLTRMDSPARLVVEFFRRGESPKRLAPPNELVAVASATPAPSAPEAHAKVQKPTKKFDAARFLKPRELKAQPIVWVKGPYPQQPPARPLPSMAANYGLLPIAPPPPPEPMRTAPTTVVASIPRNSGAGPKITHLDDDPLPGKSAPAPAPGASPAESNSTGDRSLIRALGLKVGRIVIDPGHGGTDFGTTGPTGLREKDLVLDLAKRLGDLIEERLGSEVIYTRTDDSYVGLEERTKLANERKADLFISIHGNSSPAREAVGIETFYLNFNASASAMEVAARENATSRKSVGELHDLVEKIALNTKVKESQEFAAKVQSSLTANETRGRDRGVKRAPFIVLIGATMPSILTEVGFLSNAREEGQLKKPEYRQKLAESLFNGVAGYARSLSHFSQASTKPPARPAAGTRLLTRAE